MTESQASRALRDATEDLTPDVEHLVRGGVARGRTLRRRRRVGTSLAALAVVGVIGVAASVGPGLLDGEDTSSTPVASDPPSDVPSESPSSATAVRVPAVTGDEVATTFAEVAPGGPGEVEQIEQGSEGGMVSGIFRWNGFYVSTIVSKSVVVGDARSRCEETADPDAGSCVELDDGRWAWTRSGTTPEAEGGVSTNLAAVYADDGFDVILAVSNADRPGPRGQILADEPPLSIEEVLEVAASDRWFEMAEREGRALAVTDADVADVVGGLFPGGVVTEQPSQGDEALGVLDGKLLWDGFALSVVITPALEHVDDAQERCAADVYVVDPECVPLADGAWGVSGTASWEALAGGAINVASVSTADGWDVVVMATNAAGDDGPVLADEPPFTPEQLLEAASSDVWFTTS